jgi:type II secretory pathway component PulL
MAESTHPSTNRKTIRDQVARHPLVAFVLLAYAISWLAWFIMYRIDKEGDQVELQPGEHSYRRLLPTMHW